MIQTQIKWQLILYNIGRIGTFTFSAFAPNMSVLRRDFNALACTVVFLHCYIDTYTLHRGSECILMCLIKCCSSSQVVLHVIRCLFSFPFIWKEPFISASWKWLHQNSFCFSLQHLILHHALMCPAPWQRLCSPSCGFLELCNWLETECRSDQMLFQCPL